ncbi:MAG: hemerythrin domain-containing protein [Rhizobiales bacterium]|nr:hemerythrin domain-containing protein [Hyphomicrobiales bacterium]
MPPSWAADCGDDVNAPPLVTALDARTGLPADLTYLLARYPREQWRGHNNLGEMARFWLARHDMFRELGRMLEAATTDFREGQLATAEFRVFFAPRLQFFLEQLNDHHYVEDHHYFPLFRAAEAKLSTGFDLLDGDHAALHARIMASVEAANAFLRALADGGDAQMRAAEAYAVASGALLGGLTRHLTDEEDLIVPLILDRGEAALGVGH